MRKTRKILGYPDLHLPISNFEMLSKTKGSSNGDRALIVYIPDDLEIKQKTMYGPWTTSDNRPLNEFETIRVIYLNGSWIKADSDIPSEDGMCRICHRHPVKTDGLCGYCNRRINGTKKTCKTCGSQFSSKSSRDVICDKCKKDRDSERESKRPKNIYDLKSYSCPICGKGDFRTYSGLIQHKKMHDGAAGGWRWSEESRRRMSESRKGVSQGSHSREWNHHISEGQRGIVFSEERKRHISEGKTGIKPSDEARRNMSDAQKRRLSDPHERQKLIDAMNRPETKRKLSKEARKRMEDPLYRRKLSESLKETYSDPARRKRISDGIKRFYRDNPERIEDIRRSRRGESWPDDADRFIRDPEFARMIIESFDDKPTYWDVEERLGIHNQYIGRAIHRFGLADHIKYMGCDSRKEKEIEDLIRSLGFECFKTRAIIPPKEIDVYIPEKKVGIEFDGSYYHNDSQIADRNYHLEKTEDCSQKNVRLIHIFEWEWDEKNDLIKSLISSSLGLNKRVYARDCNIVDVDPHDATVFLNENHLQGSIGSSYRIGLEYHGDLVSVMTFGRPRFSKFRGVELLRFATKMGLTIVGGESRLFKNACRRFGFTDVISYCNRSKFTGNGYERMGFSHVRDTSPGYVWINLNTKERMNRYQTQMKNEDEIMRSRGFVKIFDCGNGVYEWHK